MKELLKYANKLGINVLDQYRSINQCKKFVNFNAEIINKEDVAK
jgi:indole-3-glycerol phosphate synthase